MATLIPNQLDAKRGVVLSTLGIPSHRYDSAFDSYLILHEDGCNNHTMTLVLKLFLNPLTNPYFPIFPKLDADDELYLAKSWKAPEWSEFTQLFKKRCSVWSNRFWLAPPAGFKALDVKSGGRTIRPNIYCHLHVEIVGSAGNSHRTIDVVNLHTGFAAAKLGQTEAQLNSGSFRSHEGMYDSLDVQGRTNYSRDKNNTRQVHPNYQTIAHEVGHAIGLPHIGVSHADPMCRAAIIGDALMPNGSSLRSYLPAIFVGGANGQACYGHRGEPGLANNVMGMGTTFDETNAQPWRDRIALHTGTKAEDWKVSMGKIRPAHV